MAASNGQLAEYARKRAALLAAAEAGTDAASALSDLTDEAVSALAGAASSAVGSEPPLRAPFAIFALGGYGAGRLLPHSDIDLLVVTDAPKHEVERLVRGVAYPLWDLGLSVGHQVRRPKDQARAMTEDLEILTSFLTARQIAGDAAVAETTIALVFRKLRRLAVRTLAALSERERPGSPYLLEPDLKSGAGGQRDIDELVWRCALEAGRPVADCSGLSALTEGERGGLRRAQAAITTARWRLQEASTRPTNLMTVEDAQDLGINAEATQRALEFVHHTLLAVRERAAGAAFAPSAIVGLPDLARLVALPDAVNALERRAYARRLDAAVPGFSQLMTVRRPALSHRYTVGAHALRTLALSAENLSALTLRQADALLIAALAHDFGKREEGSGHPERGAAAVPGIARALGAEESIGADAATLVREHLLLSEVATTRDLADEDVVLAAAARLGDRELVAPLFALTAADMRATGPDVWTPWRASLVSELAGKLDEALSPETDGAGIVTAAEDTRREALRLALSEGASRRVLAFLEHAPLRYLARRTPADALGDARLVQSLAGPGLPGEVSFGVRPGPIDGTWLVDVVTRDRPGLFALISGCLALVGLDALSAEAFTDSSGIALDTFGVTSATLAPVEPASWSAFERALRTALRDPAGLDARLEERRRHYVPQREVREPSIAVAHVGPFTSAVRVKATDRVGLLHDLAHAIGRAGLDIRRATVTTVAGVADDTFEVVDAEGNPPARDLIETTLVPLLREAASPTASETASPTAS